MMHITLEMIDAAARHLRETTQSGKSLTAWDKLPKGGKKKWMVLAASTLAAAKREWEKSA